jgi:hypothetical protein
VKLLTHTAPTTPLIIDLACQPPPEEPAAP